MFWGGIFLVGSMVHFFARKPELLVDAIFNMMGLFPSYIRYACARIWARFQTRLSQFMVQVFFLEWAVEARSTEGDMMGIDLPEESVMLIKFSMLLYFTGAIFVYRKLFW